MSTEASTDMADDGELQLALAEHRAGRLAAAAAHYQRILAVRPYHAVANHNLGLLHGQQGEHDAALPYFQAAWSINPDEGQFWLSYANGLLSAGQPQQALELIEMAVQRGLDTPQAQGILEQARAAAGATAAGPAEADMQQLAQLYQSGQYAALEQHTRALLAGQPESALLWGVLGTALQLQHKDELAALQKCVALAPDDAEGHSNLGNAWQTRGQFEQAIASYASALRLQPEFAEAHGNLGSALCALGRLPEAAASFQRALAIQPDYGLVWRKLGETLSALGQPAEAAAAYQAALQLEPDNADLLCKLALSLQALERWEEAGTLLARALTLAPNDVPALRAAGDSAINLEQTDLAAAYYRRILELEPDSAEAHMLLGIALMGLRQHADALPLLQQACTLAPQSAPALNWLGQAQHRLKQYDEAIATFQRATELAPEDGELHNMLGLAYHSAKRNQEAEACHRQALALEPENALFHGNLGVALQSQSRYQEAESCQRAAVACDPDYALAHLNLGNCLHHLERPHEAVDSFRRALALQPDLSNAPLNLASTLSNLGRLEEAVQVCRDTLQVNPDYCSVHNSMLFCLSHLGDIEPAQLYAEHRRFAEKFEAPLRSGWTAHGNARDPERVLRIGFVSGDFYQHAVANFILPVLECLVHSPRVSLYGYYNHTVRDSATLRLQACLPHWRDVAPLSDEELAGLIREDGIDILIDLSGHTGRNRLLTFARKPAPLQASWIGYPGTTGLDAMDYFLTDRYLLPAEFASQYAEAFAYMPASAPFLPSGDAPPVNALPARQNGFITFGSFNRSNKINAQTIALWSSLMRAVPSSHLLLAAMTPGASYDELIASFAAQGIARERLSFQPRTNMRGYLSLHHQVDIALDTFPYTGGTTTLHGVWMGVPMLTLAGATMPARVSAAVLERLGLSAFVAHTADDYVEKGRYITSQLDLLASLRARMRQLLAQSALGQPGIIAVGLEGAARAMWHRWCAGLAPETFEVELTTAGDDAAPPSDL
ncbi:tetratricopeptide repeat protein [Massilia sp. MB5]|uniref:tetratricopeptide repeat protein n=1 Tax=Massilia sp. MB5 TaxID=2919578 RepID=UPI001F106FF5|nr:tetratricopeptide repeat protein [Massilia sp. MB5]UMR29864.1 tetratricopeptide repeat protein [Massilia sp. MB5]